MSDFVNGEILTVARESRGRTQAEVADAARVTQGLISKAENGLLSLTPEEVRQVADFLKYPASLFYQSGRLKGAGSGCLYHRKRKTLPGKLLRQLDARMFIRNLNVQRLLSDLNIDTQRVFHTMDLDEYQGSPEKVAQALRAAWRVPVGPIADLTGLIESAGGIVVMMKMTSNTNAKSRSGVIFSSVSDSWALREHFFMR